MAKSEMILHISHNDLDGIACGIIVKACLPSVDTVYAGYDDLEERVEFLPGKYSSIVITDLGPSESVLNRIAGEAELLLIDHHKSTEQYKEYPFVVHSNEKCAAMLTYEYYSGLGYDLKKYENFIESVNDYDLWKLKRDDSLQMNILLKLLGNVEFEKRFLNTPYVEFTPEERVIIKMEEDRRDLYITNAAKTCEYFTDIEGRELAVVFAESYASELGNYILSNSRADYVIIINAQKRKVSMRSNKEIDISKIAVRNGGGGHKNAAGFNLKHKFDLEEFLYSIKLI